MCEMWKGIQMSNAWEITNDDVYNVLSAHNMADSVDDKIVESAHDMITDEADRIEQAVLAYTEMEDQTDAALSEIEDILIEQKIIEGDKKFYAP